MCYGPAFFVVARCVYVDVSGAISASFIKKKLLSGQPIPSCKYPALYICHALGTDLSLKPQCILLVGGIALNFCLLLNVSV